MKLMMMIPTLILPLFSFIYLTKTPDYFIQPHPQPQTHLPLQGFSLITPLDLREEAEKTFLDHAYHSYRLKESLFLYRVGNSTYEIGEYFTFSQPRGDALSARIDNAILPKWPGETTENIIDTVYCIQIPSETIIHVGKSAPQGGIFVGGKKQVFIEKAWKISGIKVVSKYPIEPTPKVPFIRKTAPITPYQVLFTLSLLS